MKNNRIILLVRSAIENCLWEMNRAGGPALTMLADDLGRDPVAIAPGSDDYGRDFGTSSTLIFIFLARFFHSPSLSW